MFAGMLCLLALPAVADIGTARADILACAGPPHRALHVGDFEYLYYRGAVAPASLPSASAHMGRGEPCETIVVLRDGRSVAAEWRRSSDLLRAQLCTTTVNACLD